MGQEVGDADRVEVVAHQVDQAFLLNARYGIVRRVEVRYEDTCAYRISYPAILMVQSTQPRAEDDIPGPLNAARDRGILVQ